MRLLARNAREHGRACDLVTVEVQDRQDRTVPRRIQELVGVPARGERARLRLAVADDARRDQPRVVEHRAVRMLERVTELAAFVDRPRHLGRHVTRYSARKRELPEQPLHAGFVHRNIRIQLAVRAFQVGVRDEPGPPCPGPVM